MRAEKKKVQGNKELYNFIVRRFLPLQQMQKHFKMQNGNVNISTLAFVSIFIEIMYLRALGSYFYFCLSAICFLLLFSKLC